MQTNLFHKKVINDKRTQVFYGGIKLGSVLYGDFGKYHIESERPTEEWSNEIGNTEEDPHFDSIDAAMVKLYEVYKPLPMYARY